MFIINYHLITMQRALHTVPVNKQLCWRRRSLQVRAAHPICPSFRHTCGYRARSRLARCGDEGGDQPGVTPQLIRREPRRACLLAGSDVINWHAAEWGSGHTLGRLVLTALFGCHHRHCHRHRHRRYHIAATTSPPSRNSYLE